MRFFSLIIFLFSLLLSTVLVAANKFDIAVISDGPNQQPNPIEEVLIDELLALTEGEFDVTIKRYEADWTLQGFERVYQQAYANPAIVTKSFIDDGAGNVKGLQTVLVEWKDNNGRMEMREIPGSEQVIEADLVLLAMGFIGPETEVSEPLNIELAVCRT